MPRTFARLSAFMRGKVVGMAEAGMRGAVIANKVFKKDGKHPTVAAVRKLIARAAADTKWQGVQPGGPGRPRTFTASQRTRLVRLVFKYRGQKCVTTKFCRQHLPFLREASRFVVADELKAAGLAWLRRRRKVWIPEEKREARMAYGKSMMKRRARTLKSFAYTDGTTVYLARDDVEEGDQRRRRLGAHVWKMSSGSDGLFSDNVGPSLYAANQGRPVKIWGFFANGRLMYYILPADGKSTVHMNGPIFRAMMTRYANKWKKACFGSCVPLHIPLVQDHERCLWQEKSLKTLRQHGLSVEKSFPKSSPDLNAIEGVWAMLRKRLDESAPLRRETRDQFVIRLRRQVCNMNKTDKQILKRLCTNQKERAKDVARLMGARTRW